MEEGAKCSSINFIYIWFYIDRSKTPVTSKKAFFVTLVNVSKLSTNVTNVKKISVSDVAGNLDMRLF